MAKHLVWFRHDLRVTDNLALSHACQDPNAEVLALFIATPEQWKQHNMSARQATFIFKHLQELQLELAAINIPLIYLEVADFAASIDQVLLICKQYQITGLFYNYQYEWNEAQRDKKLQQRIPAHVSCYGFDDSVLMPPGSVITGQGEMYKVFTPFSYRFIQQLQLSNIRVLPAPIKRRICFSLVLSVPIVAFSYPQQDSPMFTIGEKKARMLLNQFCTERVQDYRQQRDIPCLNATSHLSAYLAIGVLSPRQCYARLQTEHPLFLQQRSGGAFCWFNELIWREFYRHLLVAFPRLSQGKPFIDWTDKIDWLWDEKKLTAWQQGKTGYPIVDAAMRQLNQTGWMHNRLRMIVASFLVKDLLIDWRWGERYFMSQLIDGDLAANNGGWQWAASTGTDAAPYFRIFNPTTQGKRFDTQGHFIRQWLPELNNVPDSELHQPHHWATKKGITIDYPETIVNHAEARLQTLNAFDKAKIQRHLQ